MIKKLDIQSFGCFQNIDWGRDVVSGNGQPIEFSRLNIIYGHNYSGKTTLSRIFQSMEWHELPKYIPDGRVDVFTDSDQFEITDDKAQQLDIRVYNREFVKKNLRFLFDNESEEGIIPFAILGSKNIENEKEIESLKAELGSAETETGLQGALQNLVREREALEAHVANLINEMNESMFEVAKKIRENQFLYGKYPFNKNHLASAIEQVGMNSTDVLSSEREKSLVGELNDSVLPRIGINNVFNSDFAKIYNETTYLMNQSPALDVEIEELSGNVELREWVYDGMKFHGNGNGVCKYCDNQISTERFELLQKYFNEESKRYRQSVNSCINMIREEISKIKNIQLCGEESIYSKYKDRYFRYSNDLNEVREKYNKLLESLIPQLEEKKIGVSQVQPFGMALFDTSVIVKKIRLLNGLFRANDNYGINIENRKNECREKLFNNQIVTFVKSFDYFDN